MPGNQAGDDRYFDVPDNTGEKLLSAPVVEGGPVAYESDLPNEKIVDRLREDNIPAVVSFHAGTHLCNQMLYSVLDLVEMHGLNTVSGFVHVPQSTDNVALKANRDAICSSMSIPMMTQAVRLAVGTALGHLNQRR